MENLRKKSPITKAGFICFGFSLCLSLGSLLIWVCSSERGEMINGRDFILCLFIFFGLPAIIISSLIGLSLGIIALVRIKTKAARMVCIYNLATLIFSILGLLYFFRDEIKWHFSDTHHLQTAVQGKDYAEIQKLFKKGIDVNQVCSENLPLLLQAIEDHDKTLLNLILEYNPDMTVQSQRWDSRNFTALHFLAKQNPENDWIPTDIAIIFLTSGVNPNIVGIEEKNHYDKQKVTALKLAYLYDNQPMVELLLNAGTDINLIYEDNTIPKNPFRETDTLLKIAIAKNDLSMTKVLVDANADLFYVEKKRSRSLFAYAVKNASLDIVRCLLENYPSLLTERKEMQPDEFPLNVAALSGRMDVLEWLVRAGMDMHAEDQYGRCLLHYAGSVEMVDFMIAAGFDINHPDRDRNTPLHCAAQRYNPDIIKSLLAYGANPNSQNSQRKTPLHLVIDCWNKGAAEALIEAGANITANDRYGESFVSALRTGKSQKVTSQRYQEMEEILQDLQSKGKIKLK